MNNDAPARPPDVLLVVMDCMRADVFERALAGGASVPFLRSLRKEVLSFPGAVAPSSWTIPSHASLFTGLYPWEHGAHNKSGATLTSGPETLAGYLGRAGYATGCFTANGYIQPGTGLTRGFSEVQWGGDREFFLRFLKREAASCPDLGGATAGLFNRLPNSPKPSAQWYAFIAALTTFPAVWDAANRLGGKILGTRAREVPQIGPWVEPQVDAWLSKQPPDRPVFVFVNLLEAHEPYLANAGRPATLSQWLGYARAKQDAHRWLRGTWTPTPRELAVSRESYEETLPTLDARVARLVETFQRRGRWDRTLFVLTSDHGQAFLEHDTLYHRLRLDEELTRIPLWIRGPGVDRAGATVPGWISLLDVPRTIVESAGGRWFGNADARSLVAPSGGFDGRVVHSMTDGLMPEEAPELPSDRRKFLDRLEVASYRGAWKSISGVDGTVRLFRVAPDDPTVAAAPVPASDETREMEALGREMAEIAAVRVASQPYHGSVERRIAGWGY
jgi:arylsulfatase A-like enzyme